MLFTHKGEKTNELHMLIVTHAVAYMSQPSRTAVGRPDLQIGVLDLGATVSQRHSWHWATGRDDPKLRNVRKAKSAAPCPDTECLQVMRSCKTAHVFVPGQGLCQTSFVFEGTGGSEGYTVPLWGLQYPGGWRAGHG